MPNDEREDLLQRLIAVEGQLQGLEHELQQIKSELAGQAPRPRPPRPEPAEPVKAVGVERSTGRVAAKGWLASDKSLDLEFWLGGRGLLLLGVTALVLAVGFFVKEAIERGWIGPTVRVLLGAGVGVCAVVVGERIRARGYRVYGLWLAAGGFGAIYVSVWAAAALYALVSVPIGFLLMVVVVAAAALVGLLRRSESFVVLAAFGGYLAPILLPVEVATNVFGLGYLGLLSAAGLWLGYQGRWAFLASMAVTGGTVLPVLSEGSPHLHGVYLVALIAAALVVSRQRRWHYLSLLTVVLGWLAFWAGSDVWGIHDISFSAYAGAIWLANLIASLGVTDWLSAAGTADGEVDRPALRQDPQTVFAELTGLAVTLAPPWFFFFSAMVGIGFSSYNDIQAELGFVLALSLGTVYVAQAYWGRPGVGAGSRFWRAVLGYAFWIWAPSVLWSGIALIRAWLAEGVVLTTGGVSLRRHTARAAGLAAFALAALAYWGGALVRPESDPAFISGWAFTGLGASLSPLVWSLALARVERAEAWEAAIRPVFLVASTAFFLGWGTSEIIRFYDLLGDAERWTLARDLSISAFWMGYAAALLAGGFWLQQPPVRWAGLGMALIAAAKVFLYDLSQLSQLYRIVSFVLLAIVLLTLSFRYQRWRRS